MPGFELEQARNPSKETGFAAAVRPFDHEQLSGRDRKVERLEQAAITTQQAEFVP